LDFLRGGLNLDFLTGLLKNQWVIWIIIAIVAVFAMRGAFKRH
jgi:hypothetical protein